MEPVDLRKVSSDEAGDQSSFFERPKSAPPQLIESRSRPKWMLPGILGAGILVVGVLIGASIGSNKAESDAAAVPTPTVTKTVERRITPPPVTVTVTPNPLLPPHPGTETSPPEPEGPKSTIFGGTWTVGVDIVPGKYRVTNPLQEGAFCYWGIYVGGSNKQNIIQNGIEEGGSPTVTLSDGQEFESNGCGSWNLQQ